MKLLGVKLPRCLPQPSLSRPVLPCPVITPVCHPQRHPVEPWIRALIEGLIHSFILHTRGRPITAPESLLPLSQNA